MAYDEHTSQLVVFGGETLAGGFKTDTWAYQTVGTGYRFVASDGGVFTFDAPYHVSTGTLHLNQPIVGMAADPGTGGYWIAAADSEVFAFDAPSLGSAANVPLAQPIVGIAAAPDGQGYWLAGADGSIYNYGPGAPRDGAPNGPLPLNRPIVGIAADPATGGYRLVASDGGLFAVGASYHGSTGNIHLNQPIVGIASDPATGGYWLVAKDGGVFAFNAPFYGSTGNIHLNQPIVGMTAAPDGQGYWLVAKDGGIFSFGPGAPLPRIHRKHPTQPTHRRYGRLGVNVLEAGGVEGCTVHIANASEIRRQTQRERETVTPPHPGDAPAVTRRDHARDHPGSSAARSPLRCSPGVAYG
jgi:hypothetical protein